MFSKVQVEDMVSSLDATSIPVGTGATVYTKAKSIAYSEYFSIMFKATSSGAIGIGIWLEQSYALPTTEGSSDAKWVVPDSGTVLIDLADANWHILTLSPKTLPFLRFKLIGTGGNDASTVIQIKLSRQPK